MGLDLWFPDDVKRILAATHETMDSAMDGASLGAAAPADPDVAAAYRQGFVDALRAVAVAFGVAQPSVAGPAALVDQEFGADCVQIIDLPRPPRWP